MSKIIQIPLTRGVAALINEEDFELVSSYKWYARKTLNGFYATCSSIKRLHMHRLIMGVEIGEPIFIDHKNMNGLDNTRSNLRLATHTQNMCNRGSYKNRSSLFKGVYWNKEKQRWTCQISIPLGKTIHVGHFLTETEAALAYNIKAIELHGEFAFQNVISS